MLLKLLACLLPLFSARLLLDVQGNLELVPIRTGSNFTLPAVTYLRDEADTPFNLLGELRLLRAAVDRLQILVQDLQAKPPACEWEGVRCHCFYKASSTLDDYLLLMGTNCSGGTLGVPKVLDMLIATTISVGCSFFNTTGRCADVVQ
jgi:hypothetical protein